MAELAQILMMIQLMTISVMSVLVLKVFLVCRDRLGQPAHVELDMLVALRHEPLDLLVQVCHLLGDEARHRLAGEGRTAFQTGPRPYAATGTCLP